ncbi:hypothetical protein [Novosphingobium kaempferiae]|uniref:hypothetical protein n=1 Tax=Novosphingobium kaempferiae TaxID=2896849 RepID=UPI001E49DAD8|nr:hypothetical protein [Novosphingobium kaempferiae]
MKRSAEIEAIAAIRRLREERAQAGVIAEAARLAVDETEAGAARDAARRHDQEVELRELHLLQALGLDAMGQAELGRVRAGFLNADLARSDLLVRIGEAECAVAARRVRLDDLRTAWRKRLRERDRIDLALADALRGDVRERELAEEMESEDLGGPRPC